MDGKEPKFENERRLLLALLLSSAVLFLTPYVFQYFYPTPEGGEIPAAQSETLPAATPSPAQNTPPGVETESPLSSPPPGAELEPSSPATVALPREVTVENEDLFVTFSNVAAIPVSIQLKNYRDEAGNLLELLPQGLPPETTPPFTLGIFDADANAELAGAVFEFADDTPRGNSLQAPLRLTFRYRSQRLDVVRRYEIPAQGFIVPTTADLRLDRTPVPYRITIGPGIGPIGEGSAAGWMDATGDFAYPQLAYSLEGSVERVTSAEEIQTLNIRPEWVAFDSKYFSYVVLGSAIQQLQIRGQTWELAGPEGEAQQIPLLIGEVELAASSPAELFFGPKDLGVLRAVHPGMGDLVDFGFFGILVEPLLFALKAIHGVIGNYGWSIIILTFFINLILVPIRYKQTTSMKKMSLVQPQMKAIQDRYKKLDRTDPKKQEMNKEIMELYQQHGINPLGGCLPLLVQMPFLFAFYRMLAYVIELREAPFMFWIADLSRPDPYYVTPIVMGVTMVAQQQMMPSTADATQRRMMMFMPILFTYFFLSVSSGLAVYFLFSNIFGMLFQWGMGKMSKPEEEIKPSSNPKGESKKGKKKR